jgi:hypothetical protein
MKLIKRIYKSFMSGPVYLVLFGLVFYGIGAGLTYRKWTYQRDGIQVQGEVTGLSQNCDDDGCTYKPNVRFQTEDGESVSFQSLYSSSPPAYDKGEKVQVLYIPDDPEKAIIEDEGRWFRIIFMIVGGLVIFGGLGSFASNLRVSIFEEITDTE